MIVAQLTVGPSFHIAEARASKAARRTGEYRMSTRGKTLDEVGFIHCSHRHQVERVANAAYRDAGPLLLLTVDPAQVRSELREERYRGHFSPFIERRIAG